jgi:hypothetical protein
MSLFHEAWLDATTDDRDEAVIHTNGQKANGADERYELLLRGACREAFRILKPGKCMSVVFGNSSGRIWSMVQNILLESGFEPRPVHIGILDKGQRSVKGLTSGFESVSTLDLILTVRKPEVVRQALMPVRTLPVSGLIEEAVQNFNTSPDSSHPALHCSRRRSNGVFLWMKSIYRTSFTGLGSETRIHPKTENSLRARNSTAPAPLQRRVGVVGSGNPWNPWR